MIRYYFSLFLLCLLWSNAAFAGLFESSDAMNGLRGKNLRYTDTKAFGKFSSKELLPDGSYIFRYVRHADERNDHVGFDSDMDRYNDPNLYNMTLFRVDQSYMIRDWAQGRITLPPGCVHPGPRKSTEVAEVDCTPAFVPTREFKTSSGTAVSTWWDSPMEQDFWDKAAGKEAPKGKKELLNPSEQDEGFWDKAAGKKSFAPAPDATNIPSTAKPSAWDKIYNNESSDNGK
jgi:hypothetical protein